MLTSQADMEISAGSSNATHPLVPVAGICKLERWDGNVDAEDHDSITSITIRRHEGTSKSKHDEGM